MILGSTLLGLAWVVLLNDFSPLNLAIGWLLGHAVLLLLGKGGVVASWREGKIARFLGLAGFFLWELLVANIRIALDVIRPQHRIRPGVVAIPLDVTSDGEILLLSALINITPGSVTIDVSDDKRTLYVHVMHIEDVEVTRREIKEGFERRVQLLFS